MSERILHVASKDYTELSKFIKGKDSILFAFTTRTCPPCQRLKESVVTAIDDIYLVNFAADEFNFDFGLRSVPQWVYYEKDKSFTVGRGWRDISWLREVVKRGETLEVNTFSMLVEELLASNAG